MIAFIFFAIVLVLITLYINKMMKNRKLNKGKKRIKRRHLRVIK